MSDLEQFAAALLAQWRADGGTDGGPITVAALMDKVLPYRLARRMLGIDVSEDYEALVLRLIAEEDQLVTTEPLDAAEMAKATASSKLPDLDVLQLLRAATVTVTRQSMARLETMTPAPRETAPPRPAPVAAAPPRPQETSMEAASVPPMHVPASEGATACWSCSEALPAGRVIKFCPFCGADQREPVCGACGAPMERRWKHCAECGVALS